MATIAELLTACSHAAGSVVVVPHVLLAAACIAACEPIANIAATADGASTVDRLGTFSLADVRTRWRPVHSVSTAQHFQTERQKLQCLSVTVMTWR